MMQGRAALMHVGNDAAQGHNDGPPSPPQQQQQRDEGPAADQLQELQGACIHALHAQLPRRAMPGHGLCWDDSCSYLVQGLQQTCHLLSLQAHLWSCTCCRCLGVCAQTARESGAVLLSQPSVCSRLAVSRYDWRPSFLYFFVTQCVQ